MGTLLALVMRWPLGMTVPAALQRSFSVLSMLRSLSSTYHSLCRSSQDLGRRSAASQARPATACSRLDHCLDSCIHEATHLQGAALRI